MKKVKNITFLLFLAVCLMQWYVPLSMIWEQESLLKNGKIFKFKTRPIDPNDPFRGKFIVLNYEADSYKLTPSENWSEGAKIYVILKEDTQGFAQIDRLEATLPKSNENYVKAEIQRIWGNDPRQLRLRYPFERFYMEENKAPKAEQLFRNMTRGANAYSLVVINQGKSALKDVIINGASINKAIKESKPK